MAQWYYVQNGSRVGPISESDLHVFVQNGTIGSDTLIWSADMTDWKPLREARPQLVSQAPATQLQPAAAEPSSVPAPEPASAPAQQAPQAGGSGALETCSECGNPFRRSDMLQFGQNWVCANCKPAFEQKLREGAEIGTTMRFAGVFRRWVADLLDTLIMTTVTTVINMAAGVGALNQGWMGGGLALAIYLVSLAMNIAYGVWFLGRFGATPGKMALGVKVVVADGSKVSYLRALGRYFAEMLSGFTLLIGYIIAIFDEQKRTLHDRLCETRVILVR